MQSPSRIERRLPPLTFVGWLLLAVRIPLVAIWLTICSMMHIVVRFFIGRSRWPRRFLRGALFLIGARVRTTGTPQSSHALFLANHQSWLDILALGGTSGTRFLSKAEIGDVPLVGWLAGLNETIFVTRERKLDVANQVEALREALIKGRPVAIFPEGTTHGGTQLLPFKPALLKVMEPPLPGVTVQPIHIDFGEYREELAWGAETGLYNALRIAARPRGFVLTVHYLEPLDPAAYPNRKALSAAAHRAVAESMARATPLSTAPPSDYRPGA